LQTYIDEQDLTQEVSLTTNSKWINNRTYFTFRARNIISLSLVRFNSIHRVVYCNEYITS